MIEPDTKKFTTGAEEIRMLLPQIAFTPTAGWSPFTAAKGDQDPAKTRIANPNLLGTGGMITCLLFPADGITLSTVVDRFTGNSRIVERTDKISTSGIPITFVHMITRNAKHGVDGHSMHCFFANDSGQIVDLYCVGSTESSARATTNEFLKTLRIIKPNA